MIAVRGALRRRPLPALVLLCLALGAGPGTLLGRQQPQAGQQAPPPPPHNAQGAKAKTGAAAAQKPQPPPATAPASPPAAPGKPGRRPASGAAAPPAGSAGKQPPSSSTSPITGAPSPDLGNIDQILEGDEEVLAGNTFTYDPGNRRDPFKSLLIAADRPEFRGPRPEGIPGLLIDEIDLKGIFRTARGYVAQVNASNQKKSYLIKEGDQLYDGDVVSIGKNEVVFKQIVQDPSALKPFREIVKSLNPQ
ncbi:MAG TPA: hypothetical protein VE075_12010 [Thermoanaerobaculia bacterium]|nr:hypothetical protein [Thermoanaerobaculia bacterium]